MARNFLAAASAAIRSVETILSAIAQLSLLLIMLIVVADVLMRYAFRSPLVWSYVVVGNYLMVSLFFLMLSKTLQANHHISIDIFQNALPFRIREILLSVGLIASAVIMGLIAWQSYLRLRTAFWADERLAATIPWPTWVTYAILTIGVSVFVLRIVHRALEHLASALLGVPLDPDHQAVHSDLDDAESPHPGVGVDKRQERQ